LQGRGPGTSIRGGGSNRANRQHTSHGTPDRIGAPAHGVHGKRYAEGMLMNRQSLLRPLSYLLLAGGCLLAFIAALVPHYDAGHRLMVSVLLTGLLPYLVLGLALPYLRGWALALPALVGVATHAWLVLTQRFLDYQGYSDGMIYYVPLALAAAATGVLIWALRTSPCGTDG